MDVILESYVRSEKVGTKLKQAQGKVEVPIACGVGSMHLQALYYRSLIKKSLQ